MKRNWRPIVFTATAAWSVYAAFVVVSTAFILRILQRGFEGITPSQLVVSIVGVYLLMIILSGWLLDLNLQRRQIVRELRISEIVFQSQEPMLVTDATGTILRINEAFTRETGYGVDDVIGKNPRVMQSGRHTSDFYLQMWESIRASGQWQGEIWDKRKDGSIYPKWLSIAGVFGADGRVTHYVGGFTDLSERKEAAAKIAQLAYYDALTGLPNRHLFMDRLRHALSANARNQQYGALLYIDLDKFKIVNDTLGHEEGDRLLREAGRRLQEAVREGDTVARLGGDEFVIVLENLGAIHEDAAFMARAVCEKLIARMSEPYWLANQEFSCPASIRITLWHGEFPGGASELLKQADVAMYEAKRAGRNTVRFFDPAIQSAIENQARLENRLRTALQRRQFQLYFQLQVQGDGAVRGAEALLRWNDPERGAVSPAEFIPVAEETGVIVSIGRWVLQSACEQLRRWQGIPAMRNLRLSVNISAKQFASDSFVSDLVELVRASEVNPALLELELTETVLLENVDDAIEKMMALRKLGITFALDDFGTGYSSLSYLRKLPLDVVKIDRSFVLDLGANENSKTIVRTIIQMAQNLGLRVIAEGVETEAQQRILSGLGCDVYQGYRFGRPAAIEEFENHLMHATIVRNEAVPIFQLAV
ncbi:diguanylate cyclase/phosphodiesterase with PAS/PAC and GAF sensor [Burkholderiales bacterium GJ-E10]|nr:diguanylate cyclase/phosphodiesterase with PAS/PAC and GAF sensor [Burkholderiales bacterium GJ-E10]